MPALKIVMLPLALASLLSVGLEVFLLLIWGTIIVRICYGQESFSSNHIPLFFCLTVFCLVLLFCSYSFIRATIETIRNPTTKDPFVFLEKFFTNKH